MQQYFKNQIFIVLLLCAGSLLCGITGGWSAPIIAKLQDLKQTPLPDIIQNTDISWVGSSVYIGIIIGPYITGSLSNTIGRKICLMLGGLMMVIAYTVLATAVNLPMIIVGRVLTGVGSGMIFVTLLVYMSEIASTNIRGSLIALIPAAVSLGTVIFFCIAPYVSYPLSSYLTVALALLFTAGMMFAPETPIFHLLKGNTEKAREVMDVLGRTENVEDLLNKGERANSTKKDWLEIFTVKNNRKTLFIVVLLHILQNCSGAWVLLMFATSIFDLFESENDPNVSTIIVGITMFIASCITPFVVDRYGRRILLLTSSAVSGLCMMLLGFYFFLDHIKHWIVPHLHLLPVISVVFYFLFFNYGFAVIPGTLMNEMFQSNVRGPGCTITLSIGWVFGWITSITFGYLIIALGTHTTLWFYSSMCFVCSAFTAFFVPETKGKTFAEIQCMLSA